MQFSADFVRSITKDNTAKNSEVITNAFNIVKDRIIKKAHQGKRSLPHPFMGISGSTGRSRRSVSTLTNEQIKSIVELFIALKFGYGYSTNGNIHEFSW